MMDKKIVEKKVSYNSITASEIYMVWGQSDGKMPAKNLLPANSKIEGEIIYSKMANDSNRFIAKLRLPAGTNIYYWMLQRKDKAGNATEIWDSGGDDKESFNLNFTGNFFFKAGYFIFLAGFLSLILHFYRKGDKDQAVQVVGRFKLKEYLPELDSLRAIAVLLVIFHHWLPETSLINLLPNGSLGVNIFLF